MNMLLNKDFGIIKGVYAANNEVLRGTTASYRADFYLALNGQMKVMKKGEWVFEQIPSDILKEMQDFLIAGMEKDQKERLKNKQPRAVDQYGN